MGKRQAARQGASSTNPRQIDAWLRQSVRQLQEGDLDAAVASCKRVLQAPSTSKQQRAEALCNLGVAQTHLQDFNAAYTAFSDAIALDPNDTDLWYNRGLAARLTLRLGHSVRDLERAAALAGAAPIAPRIAAELTTSRALAAQEIAYREPGFTLDQLVIQEEVFYRAVELMEAQEWAQAQQACRDALAISERLAPLWGNLGGCLMMQRRYDEAEAALRRALELDPEYQNARWNLDALPEIRRRDDPRFGGLSQPFAGKTFKMSIDVHKR